MQQRASKTAALGVLAFTVILALPAVQAAKNDAGTGITPLQQVITMMDDLLVKGKKDKHEEQVEFAKFQQWCDSTREETKTSIARAAQKIEMLTADIAKALADAEQLGEEIAELEAAVAQMESEVATATALREKELAEYTATHTDLSESIDALERAIQTLKAKEADVPQSLLQLQGSSRIPAKAKAVIAAFLQEGAAAGAPEANAYEFQSGGVVAMLEKLRLKFQDQRTVVEKEEMNAKANYEQLMQHLTDDIKYDKAQIASKTSTKTQRLEDAATAKGDKEMTEAQKADDEKKLSDTLASCDEKSKEFEQNQVTRSEEIKAIEQAQAILQSPDVTGNADTYLPTLLQVGRSLAQLRGETAPAAHQAAQRRAQAFLQDRARQTGSRYLSLVAEHMQADPFVKVKKMIKDLIVKLLEQANAEAEGKAYCDTELGTNKMTREDKQAEVEELTANVEQNTAKSAQLTADIKDLAADIADLQSQQAEATKLRTEEKAVNTKTVEDSKAAQSAVEKALSILKEFYASAAEIPGASLLQGGAAELAQQMAAAQKGKVPYKGMQASSGGIFGMLEVVLSDFARLEAETSAAEDAAQEAYDKFMAESTQDIAVKTTAKKHNEDNLMTTDALIVSLKKELALTQEELDAALAYYEKLKPTCVDLGLSYDERVQAREEEIQSLKEALAILQQEDLA